MSAPEFVFDVERARRIGLDEAVFAAGKTAAQVAAIVGLHIAREGSAHEDPGREARLLVTRLDPDKFEALPAGQRARLDYCALSRTAVLGGPATPGASAPVAVLAAGTSDLPVSREAARTLGFYGQSCTEWTDIGVAGLWRLMERLDAIRAAPVVIVAAGMDAALVSVVGGLVAGAVIAVPTSVGYGVAAGGAAALHASLASCAPGVTVVNIDNGYGAACAALRIVRSRAGAPGPR